MQANRLQTWPVLMGDMDWWLVGVTRRLIQWYEFKLWMILSLHQKHILPYIDLPVSFELVGSLCNCDLRQRLEQSQLWKMLRSCWFGSHYLPHCHWPMRAWSQVRNYSPIACHKVTKMFNSNGAFSTIVPAVRCTLTSILKPFASSWEMPE